MGGGWRAGLLLALAWAVLVFLIAPVSVVVPVSLTDTDYLALPEAGLSLRHWEALLANPAWIRAIVQSFGIAAAATVVAAMAGTLLAIGCWRLRNRWTAVLRAAVLLPVIVPTVVYALGLYRSYAAMGLLDSLTGIVLAHAALGLPYVVLTVGAALAGLDPRLEQAARSLGASPGQALRLVLVPAVRPGILSGAVFAFVVSWDELVVVLFVAGRRIHTLPREIWAGVSESLDPTIACVATLLVGVTLLALVPVLWSRRRGLAEAA